MRGEHERSCVAGFALIGSSPRAWGTRAIEDVGAFQFRFIPTCVGNTRRRSATMASSTVHPHVRGEHRRMMHECQRPSGSSPRAWGTRARRPGPSCAGRFIPTCVGNTRRLHAPALLAAVHPHVRGEHHHPEILIIAEDGSSPRAWGTPGAGTRRGRGIRFIPTCVGNTQQADDDLICFAVHPHVRGEHAP